jgi:hypothetical protein
MSVHAGSPMPETPPSDAAILLAAVRDDIRKTLRVAWVHPGIDAAADSPVFFAAAWSAVRPNVGRSFIQISRSVRTAAADAVRSGPGAPDLRKRLERDHTEGELRRMCESARAVHHAAARTQIVLHLLNRAARRERLPGTGREEPPVRRGVPEWQRWMAADVAPGDASESLAVVRDALGAPEPPQVARVFARWPAALRELGAALAEAAADQGWPRSEARLRRMVDRGVTTLPHAVGLQWTALRERGFTEDDRVSLVRTLAAHERAAPAESLAAAFVWMAFGAPEVGHES